MISVSAPIYDPSGCHIFRRLDPTAEIRSGSRRVSRMATLDGGAWAHDTGYSVADRKILVTDLRPDKVLLNWVDRMTRMYGRVRVVTDQGVYIAIPESWDLRTRGLRWSLLLMEETVWLQS